MSIKSDKWIRRMSAEHGMIEPFEPGQVRVDSDNEKIVSYGTSSYGYDVRCADEFKIFTNINHAIVDPKAFDPDSFVDLKSDVCIIPPNSFALARTVEYFRIPRSVLTVCLGKSTYARCFSAETKVALSDGRSLSLEQMAKGAEEGERYYGYGVGQFGKVIMQELEAPRLVGQDSLVEVTLDNGEVIRATPDHEFLMRDGTMCPAAELKADSSLMPLYRTLRRGYEMTYQPLTGLMYPTHEMGANDDGILAGGHVMGLRQSLTELRKNDERYADYRNRQAYRTKSLWNSDERPCDMAGQRMTSNTRPTPETSGTQHERLARYWQNNAQEQPSQRVVNHKVVSVRTVPGTHDVYCLTAPETGNFALEAGVFVSNCGIIVNVTPLEPEWEGHVTLEFSNTTPLPAKIYANEGIAQMLFFESDEICETSYADRGGKYQGQKGVTLPRT